MWMWMWLWLWVATSTSVEIAARWGIALLGHLSIQLGGEEASHRAGLSAVHGMRGHGEQLEGVWSLCLLRQHGGVFAHLRLREAAMLDGCGCSGTAPVSACSWMRTHERAARAQRGCVPPSGSRTRL